MNAIFLKVAVFHHFFLSSTKPYPYFSSRSRAVAHRNHLKTQPLSDPNRRSQIFQLSQKPRSYEFGAHLKNLEMQKKKREKLAKMETRFPTLVSEIQNLSFQIPPHSLFVAIFSNKFNKKKRREFTQNTQIIHLNEFGPASTNKANFHVTLMMSAFKKLVLSDQL